MATQPKPKPRPEPPEPKPDPSPTDEDEEAMPAGVSLLERVENLENRMAAVEERQKAPPIPIGRRP